MDAAFEPADVGDAPRDRGRYPPIRDYAAIGDCHGASLVGIDGGIGWCCLERLDAEPILWPLLDADKGGRFRIRPVAAEVRTQRSYLGATNILATTFATLGGTVRITDFMPVGRKRGTGPHNYVDLAAPCWLVRIVDCIAGRVPVQVEFKPRPGFRAGPAALRAIPRGLAHPDGPALYSDVTLPGGEEGADVTVDLSVGERRVFVLCPRPLDRGDPLDRVGTLLDTTRAYWAEWIGYCRYRGPYRSLVERSALALKLMTYAPTGAIVAALTTSLPEEIGGERNWDYRYCWLRDSCLTLYALAALGYSGEAGRFAEFLVRCCASTDPDLQIMYGIEGETRLDEHYLLHLDGYRGSRPVRVGNAAYEQRQLDVYGEILDWAALLDALGGRLDSRARSLLEHVADTVVGTWDQPEHGLWEMRGVPRHHVHGKVMSWIALDRAITLLGERDGWRRARDRIAEDIREQGLAPGGYFRQSYDTDRTDAVLLRLPMLGFPADASQIRATVEAVMRELQVGNHVHRYRTDDGLSGYEGAFLICSFWLVDALLTIDRAEEARELFEGLAAAANDVGLYAEEIDPATDEFLGNFPQAFTHLALIGSAIHLELYAAGGRDNLEGGFAERARRSVEATFGWRALWASFKKLGRPGRILPSNRSTLPPHLMR